ncbi:hypothetical protein PCASD_14923 [Puccinia coronata f. sp. avenae]|uniref:Uncharacterized protein n=1 Tax=Puccinia coronata f. sp. avenae TaxID=200324 RepID=A0A2N5TEU2_9BASI|nr:hypothetical protein PCASD_14923 [Puccinia coronata f. sp. avenae]
MYQPSVQVIPAERAVQPAHPAGTCTSRASRSACSPGWYLYQPSEQLSLLTRLVPVPAERAGQPAHLAGTCTSRASSLACSPGWYLYQPSEQVSLLTWLVPVPAERAGQPAHLADTCTSRASRSACSLAWYSIKRVSLLAKPHVHLLSKGLRLFTKSPWRAGVHLFTRSPWLAGVCVPALRGSRREGVSLLAEAPGEQVCTCLPGLPVGRFLPACRGSR